MEIIHANLPDNHTLAFLSDVHWGTIAHHKSGWEATIELLRKKKDMYCVLLGDMIEAKLVDSPHFDPSVHDPRNPPFSQMKCVVEMLKRIPRGKILAACGGNHEWHLRKWGNLHSYLCEELKVPNGGDYSFKLNVKNGSKSIYKAYCEHGARPLNSMCDDPLRREANIKLTLKRRLQPIMGDCAVMVTAHNHKLVTINPHTDGRELYLTDDGSHIHAHYTDAEQNAPYIDPNRRFYASSGCFVKGRVTGAVTYTERAGYAPTQLGYPYITVRDGKIVDISQMHLGSDS